ncbi:hypothetical protein RGU71_05970 [Bacillus thuringiensis]|uniref:hypothetical protein n=1 Tax=Bacillus thuringiensis TaxID=1428 RepID=UPI00285339EE|nr:hypothetical protein [Bacillus thuringiensis]MDR4920289.1 hypothetical protein [Bacillus thuringiensis]
MNINWITPEEAFEIYLPATNKNSYISTYKSRTKTIYSQIINTFPNSKDWLDEPFSSKKVFRESHASCAPYIICWAWKRNLFKEPVYRDALFEYLSNRSHSGFAISAFIKYLNLIEENVYHVIEDIYGDITKGQGSSTKLGLSLLCLFLMKPFKQITDEDIWAFPALFQSRRYNAKAIQDVRIRLGLTQKIVKSDRRHYRLPYMLGKQYPNWKQVFDDYYSYGKLIFANDKSKISNLFTPIKHLMEFLHLYNKDDCSQFYRKDFVLFTDYLLTKMKKNGARNNITKLKKFFNWGVGLYNLFPKTLDYPSDYWYKIDNEARNESNTSDGRAFKEAGIAEKFVQALSLYQPENELDTLCKHFWLLAISCPVRFDYIRQLPTNCLHLFPNSKKIYGITAPYPDKAGNINGQFPILDHRGLEAVRNLQKRAEQLNLKPLKNPDNKKTYHHLFQLELHPYILTKQNIRHFMHKKIKPMVPELAETLNIGAHNFRTHIFVEIVKRTRSIEIAQNAGGHHNSSMTKSYLKSKYARNALMYRLHKDYTKGELTGKFYLRLIDLISSDKTPPDLLGIALTQEIHLDEFLKQFGRRQQMGYCMSQTDCDSYFRCWGCKFFLMKREEIESAVELLTTKIINYEALRKYSNDFTNDNPVAASSERAISLIMRRLIDLNLTEEQITRMIEYKILGKDIREVLKDESIL